MALHIETDRLILRSLEAGDAEPLARIWTDPDVTRHMGGPRIFDEVRSNLLNDAGKPRPPKYDLWPLVEKATGRIVGHCGFPLSRLIALIEPENAASIRIAEKFGFRYSHATLRPGGAVRRVYALQAPLRPGTKQ